MLLAQNTESIPPCYDLAEAQRDLAVLDLLRPRFSRLRLLMSRADDTQMALGSDLLSAALEGYAIAKAFGKGAGRAQGSDGDALQRQAAAGDPGAITRRRA